jgi:hypothetical protein
MKASSFTPRLLKLALIAAPMVLGLIYYTLIASDRYTSKSIVAVKSAVVSAGPGGTISLGSGSGLLSWEDTLYLLDFVHSGSLARELEPRLKLREHFEAPRADIFYRLWPGTSMEWFIKYYQARVELEFNDINGLLTIRTQGFDPEMAEKLNRAILESSSVSSTTTPTESLPSRCSSRKPSSRPPRLRLAGCQGQGGRVPDGQQDPGPGSPVGRGQRAGGRTAGHCGAGSRRI